MTDEDRAHQVIDDRIRALWNRVLKAHVEDIIWGRTPAARRPAPCPDSCTWLLRYKGKVSASGQELRP